MSGGGLTFRLLRRSACLHAPHPDPLPAISLHGARRRGSRGERGRQAEASNKKAERRRGVIGRRLPLSPRVTRRSAPQQFGSGERVGVRGVAAARVVVCRAGRGRRPRAGQTNSLYSLRALFGSVSHLGCETPRSRQPRVRDSCDSLRPTLSACCGARCAGGGLPLTNLSARRRSDLSSLISCVERIGSSSKWMARRIRRTNKLAMTGGGKHFCANLDIVSSASETWISTKILQA